MPVALKSREAACSAEQVESHRLRHTSFLAEIRLEAGFYLIALKAPFNPLTIASAEDNLEL